MGTTNKKKMAVVYCRVSTEEQAKSGLSIDVQKVICSDAAKKDGFKNPKIIVDDGKSGGNTNRDGMKTLISLMKKRSISAVYALSGDRFNRNTFDYLSFKTLASKNEIEIRYIHQPNPDGSASSNLYDTVFAAISQHFRDTTAEKVKITQKAKVEAGIFPSVPPVGYINTKNPDKNASKIEQKIITVDEERGSLITETFQLFATGQYNGYDLNDHMHRKGLTNKNNNKIAMSRFYAMLRNRFYLGEIHYSKGRVVNKNARHEPLVDKATFNQVQAVLDSHNKHACRRRKHNFLLRGFLWCTRHDKPRRYTAEWHMDKGLAYYHCPVSGCGSKYLEMTKIESEIAESFKKLEFSPDFIQKVVEKVQKTFYERRKVYAGRKQALVNKKTGFEMQMQKAEDKLLNETLDDEEFTKIKMRLKEKIQTVNEQTFELDTSHYDDVDVAQEVLAFTKNIYKTYKKASFELKRLLLGFFWDQFEVDNGVIIKASPTLLFKTLRDLEQVYVKSKVSEKSLENKENTKVIITNALLRGQDSNL